MRKLNGEPGVTGSYRDPGALGLLEAKRAESGAGFEEVRGGDAAFWGLRN